MAEAKKLYRNTDNKVIAGVCAGIADYTGIDVTIVRLLTVLLSLTAGGGILAYIIGAVIIPEAPKSKS